MGYEKGLIRADRGLWIDKGNYAYDPRHPDFSTGADADGLRDSRPCFADCDAAALAAGANGIVGPGTYRFASNVTLSAGWELSQGAIIKPDSGVTVTFAGIVRGMGDRASTFDTSAGGIITVTGSEWFVEDSATGTNLLSLITDGGLAGDGTTSDAAALTALAAGNYYAPPGTYLIDADTTTPDDVVIHMGRGAKFSVASTYTLTIDCELVAGRSQIFAGAGSVEFTADCPTDTFYPEWFGAVADGTTGCYAAFIDLAAAVSSKGSGTIDLLAGGTYHIEEYIQDGAGNTHITFQSCDGLTLRGNGAKIDFFGAFDRASVNEGSVNILWSNCTNLRIENVELDGNVDQMTNTGGYSESQHGYGLRYAGCRDVVTENVYTHHWCTDGIRGDDYSAVTPRVACQRMKFINVRSLYNARLAMGVIQLRGAVFENCDFSWTGRASGTYGSHAPAAGVDVEPNRNTSGVGSDQMDVDTGELHFRNCVFEENDTTQFVANLPDYHDHITLEDCTIRPGTAGANSGLAFYMSDTHGRVRRCLFDLGPESVHVTVVTAYTQSDVRFEDCEFRGTHRGIESTSVQPVTFRRCKFIGEHTTGLSTYFPYFTNSSAVIEDCYLYIPSAAHSTGSGGQNISQWQVGTSRRNQFVTNLNPASAHFSVIRSGTAVHENDRFQSDNAFRSSLNSTFDHARPYSQNDKWTFADLTLGAVAYAEKAWNPASLAAGAVQSTTQAVTNCKVGDLVLVTFSLALSGTRMWGEVTVDGTVTIYHWNPTGGAVDLGSGTIRIYTIRTGR